MAEPTVTTFFKQPAKRSRQKQRRLDFEREFQAARKVVIARENGMCQFKGCNQPGRNVHHMKGRQPADANDPQFLMLFCVPHDTWVTEHPRDAKREGYSLDRLVSVLEDSSEHIRFQQVSGVDETDPEYLERFGLWVAELRAERAISECEGTGR